MQTYNLYDCADCLESYTVTKAHILNARYDLLKSVVLGNGQPIFCTFYDFLQSAVSFFLCVFNDLS